MRAPVPLLGLLALSGCVYVPVDLNLESLGKVKEVVVVPGSEETKVLMLRIDGEISSQPDQGFLSSTPSLLTRVVSQLDRAREDPAVRGILLRIDSPGGGVTASDLIMHEVQRFRKERPGTPVVAWFGDTAASGGYYVAQAAQRIVASPTTITGSIGVIAQVPQLHGLGEKIGVQVEAIKSGPNKDIGSPFRPMTAEERALLQDLIDRMYARFVDVVALGRSKAGLSRSDVLKLADGRVFTAEQALEAKLIDRIGYLEDALSELSTLGGFGTAPQVIVYEPVGLSGAKAYRYGATRSVPALRLSGGDSPALAVVERLLPGSGPTLQYLWQGGRR